MPLRRAAMRKKGVRHYGDGAGGASMVTCGYQVRLMLVLDGKLIGSQTYWGIVGRCRPRRRPTGLPGRGNCVVDVPWIGST